MYDYFRGSGWLRRSSVMGLLVSKLFALHRLLVNYCFPTMKLSWILSDTATFPISKKALVEGVQISPANNNRGNYLSGIKPSNSSPNPSSSRCQGPVSDCVWAWLMHKSLTQ